MKTSLASFEDIVFKTCYIPDGDGGRSINVCTMCSDKQLLAMGSRERALTAVGDGLGFVSSTGFPDELIERLRIRLLFSLSWTCVRL